MNSARATDLETKRCSACGAAFGCGARSEQCWCQSLPPLPRELLAPAVDCLCPRCLAERTRPDRPRATR